MGKNPFLIMMAAAAGLMLSCTAPVVHHPWALSDSYQKANFSDRRILVALPADQNIVIDNKKDVFNNYGGANVSAESRVRKYYLPLFFNGIKTLASGDSVCLVNEYRPGLSWDSLSTRVLELKTQADSMPVRYAVPPKVALDSTGLGNSVAVIIEKLQFKRNNFYIEYYWDEKTRRSANLEADATVLIWDFKNDAAVFYGTLTTQVDFQFGMQRKHWDESAQELAKKLITTAKCL